MNHNKQNAEGKGKADWMIMIVPPVIVASLSILFFFLPDQSNHVLSRIRFFLGDTFGIYYVKILNGNSTPEVNIRASISATNIKTAPTKLLII